MTQQVTIEQAIQIAVQHHQAGRMVEAERLFRQIIAQYPDRSDALHYFGFMTLQLGRFEEAQALILRSIALAPNSAEAYASLGDGLAAQRKLNDAVAAYAKAIGLKPAFAEVHHSLGSALWHLGRLDEAIAAYSRAVELKPAFAEACNNLGSALKEQGKIDQAVAAFHRAIAVNPEYAEAYFNLGNALAADEKLDEAGAAYSKAIQHKPGFGQAYSNWGNVLRKQGKLEEAIDAFAKAIQWTPACYEAHYNLANALKAQGKIEAAIAAYSTAITLKPQSAEAHTYLGRALAEQRNFDGAITACSRAVELKPDYAEGHFNLGVVLSAMHKGKEAAAAYRKAIQWNPDFAEAHANLAQVLSEMGNLPEAITAYQKAIEIKPAFADAHCNLGTVYEKQRKLDLAVDSYTRAIQIDPRHAAACNNLANVRKNQGLLDEALALYERAIDLDAAAAAYHSNQNYTLHLHPDYDPATIYAEHRKWNQRHGDPLKKLIQPHPNTKDPNRRLRIGYVSPDLYMHPVGRFLLPVLEQHDTARVEVFCYANTRKSDWLTERLKHHAGVWRNIAGLPDDRVAEVIREDRIDILVDLAGHTANNRLLVFARKPAPIQVTWLGYPDTTGMTAMDYRITDSHADPPGMTEAFHCEQIERLPDSFLCFSPLDEPDTVAPAPALANGNVTFGCFNNFCKINEPLLQLWSTVLAAIPGSRMLLLAPEGEARLRVAASLNSFGIDPGRMEFIDRCPRARYLELNHRIDIALDTFPYHGTATTCEALWMGVPVLTLAGASHVSRVGVSILTNVGMPEMVAQNHEEYIRIATELSGDLARLSAIRSQLRERMRQSSFMNAPRFARDVENAYGRMWRRWCSGRGSDQ